MEGGAGGAGAGGGAGGAPAACGGSSGNSPNANFAYIRTLVADTCGGAGCHNEAPMQPQLVDDAALYTTLTTYRAQLCRNRVLVKPCAPEESAFYLVQRGECEDVAQMPFGCVDRCTPPDDIEAIRQWIANGAPEQ
jgi:hypothetical protein